MFTKSCFGLIVVGSLVAGCTGEIGGISGDARLNPAEDIDGLDDGPTPAPPAAVLQCPGASPDVAARSGWRGGDASLPAQGALRFELKARPTAANLDALVAVGAESIEGFDQAALTVRFAEDGFIDARDGAFYASDIAYPYDPGIWYSIAIAADIDSQTYTVEIGPCGEPRQTLITNSSFRDNSDVAGELSAWGVWSSQSAALEVSTPAWMLAEGCAPATCASLGQTCGQPSDGCGGVLNCGGCENGEICASGLCVPELVSTPAPPACVPDTCPSVGLECGVRSDGCGGFLACGACQSGQTCTSGKCVQDPVTPSSPPACVPNTCQSLGRECGVAGDGCGGSLSCGGCASGEACTSGICVQDPVTPPSPPACVPNTCQSLGRECGVAGDGCGGSLSCGGCASGEACGGSGSCIAVTTPTPGSWPSPTDPLGHRHPECQALYGKTPAQIEATPCGISGGSVPGNETYTACTHTGGLDFQGSNVTFDCVNWATGTRTFGTRCEGAPGCENVVFRRTTITGSNGNAVQNLILMTSRGGQPLRSVLIEKSDISRSDVGILCGSAANGDLYPLPGEGDKALVIRDSRIHGTTQSPTAHTDLMFIAEGCRGVLSERNLWDGSDAIGGANVGLVIQDQTQNATGGNHVFRNNRFVHDGSGHMFNFDRGSNTSSSACADPVVFESNVFDWHFDLGDGFADTLFSYSTTGRECTRIDSRPGLLCANNVFADGSGASCSGDGR